jgi:tRNA A37 threonylcarbamoyladenosine modification protein TsaB
MGFGEGLAVPVLDAHKGEVYCAAYARDATGRLVERLAPFHAPPPVAAQTLRDLAPTATLWLAGDGLVRYGEQFTAPLGAAVLRAARFVDSPRAACLAAEAWAHFQEQGPCDLARLEPLYLRPSDAKLPGGQMLG